MTDRQTPNSASDWRDFLIDNKLPSPFRIGKKVLRAMHQRNQPYAKIASWISRDPILSYNIMAAANLDRPDEKEGSKTLDHAIGMIGVDQLKSAILHLPFQDSRSTDIKSYYYVRTLCSSLNAAYLGRAISQAKQQGNADEIFWASLLVGVPAWYLWRFATSEMRLVRYAIRSNFKLPEVAEREVLGTTILDISASIVRSLDLPDLVRDCYKPENHLSNQQWVRLARAADHQTLPARIEDRNLLMAMQTPRFIVMLANAISHYATHDWYSHGCLRCQRALASYLRVPLADAVRLTHESAAHMERIHPLAGVMGPAAKLFAEPRKRVKAHAAISNNTPKNPEAENQNQLATQTDTASRTAPQQTSPAAPGTAPRANAKFKNPIIEELTNIMLHRAEEFDDLHELMNAATQGIGYGIELKRASVSLVNRERTRIKTYYHVGGRSESGKGGLANFETKVIPNTVFAKLVERPASVWVKPDSNTKVTQLIPMNFKMVIDVEDFFMMSVFVNKKPIAIFYADNYQGEPLNDKQYQQFRFICGAANKALQQQARSKKQ